MGRTTSAKCLLAAAACGLCLAGTAAAEPQVSVAGGGFAPFDGENGFWVTSSLLFGATSAGWRYGVEFDARGYETKMFKIADIDADGYHLRGIVHHLWDAEGLNPYLGFGVGLSVNVVDGKKIQNNTGTPGNPHFPKPSDRQHVDGTGMGVGFILVAGIEAPLQDWFKIYGEARVDANWRIVNAGDRVNAESLSGAGGVIGLRFTF